MKEKELKEMLHSFLSFQNEMFSYSEENENSENKKHFENIENLLEEIYDNISAIEENEGFNF